MKKLYVGCSLAHASGIFKREVKDLKGKLRGSYEVLEFMDPKTVQTSIQVFENDTRQIIKCDVFLAICDLPSLGLGYEMAYANSINKPVIAVAHEDSNVSRMILGVTADKFKLVRYKRLDEVVSFMEKMLKVND